MDSVTAGTVTIHTEDKSFVRLTMIDASTTLTTSAFDVRVDAEL